MQPFQDYSRILVSDVLHEHHVIGQVRELLTDTKTEALIEALIDPCQNHNLLEGKYYNREWAHQNERR